MGVAYGWDEHAQYSAAKAGMVGLVRALAVELAADGVRVNAIAPGYIRTAQSLSEEHSLGVGGLEEAARFISGGAWATPRTSPAWSSCWPPTARATSPARPSSSTAGCSSGATEISSRGAT